ncbi:VOC family protein, partial [Rhizobium johnstonii]
MHGISMRYIVDDVDAAVEFYTRHLGFSVALRPAPSFAILTRDGFRL